MTDIIDALGQLGEIEHWVWRRQMEECGAESHYPPIIVWRYKHTSSELADFFRFVVSTCPSAIAWDFGISGRNWSLMPLRVRQHATRFACLGELEAADQLEILDPEFGKNANAELCILADHIQKCSCKRLSMSK